MLFLTTVCQQESGKNPVIGDVPPGQSPSPERPSKTYGKAIRLETFNLLNNFGCADWGYVCNRTRVSSREGGCDQHFLISSQVKWSKPLAKVIGKLLSNVRIRPGSGPVPAKEESYVHSKVRHSEHGKKLEKQTALQDEDEEQMLIDQAGVKRSSPQLALAKPSCGPNGKEASPWKRTGRAHFSVEQLGGLVSAAAVYPEHGGNGEAAGREEEDGFGDTGIPKLGH
ncbi:hypothetical protein ACLKA6_009744 [Drosophila palustris]